MYNQNRQIILTGRGCVDADTGGMNGEHGLMGQVLPGSDEIQSEYSQFYRSGPCLSIYSLTSAEKGIHRFPAFLKRKK